MNVLRVSRHEEDIMLEKQAKFVEERFSQTEDGMAKLCSAFSKFTRKSAKYRDSNDQVATALNEFASKEQINKTLKAGMENLAQSLADLGDHRDNSTRFSEEELMTSLTQYASRCKNCDSEMKNIYAAKDKEISKRRQLTKIRQRLPQNIKVIMKAEGDLVEATSKVSQLQTSLEEYAMSFEMSKLNDLKKILHDFVKAELIFHVKAVESLSKAFAHVREINVEADFQSFKDVLLQPNKAIRLDIVRNTGPVYHRVGIPRNPEDATRSLVTDQSTSQLETTGVTDKVSDAVRHSETEGVTTGDANEADESDDTDDDASSEEEFSSTIHIKPCPPNQATNTLSSN